MKVVLVVLVLSLVGAVIGAQNCRAPAPFVYGASGPYGYSCSSTGQVLLTALSNAAVVEWGSGNTVVIAKDLSYGCCNSVSPYCGSTTWTIPSSSYRLAATNYLKADGYCAQGWVNDTTGPEIAANTPDCSVDDSKMAAVCGKRENCGCVYTSCSVTALGRELSGTITIRGWGDCVGVNIFGPYAGTITLAYGCYAPPPFVLNGSGNFGYTCSNTGQVLLTALGNAPVVSFGNANTTVIAKTFNFGCCNSGNTCGNSATWTLPSSYKITTANFLKADGWCAQGYVNDSPSTTTRIAANTPDCAVDNSLVPAVCGKRDNCGCVFSSCGVIRLSRPLSGTVTLTAWGDCVTSSVYGPYSRYPSSTPTVELSYTW